MGMTIKNGVLESYRGRDKIVMIPENVTGFETRAFLWSQIERFEVSAENKKYKSENGLVLSKDGKKLILYPPEGNPDVCMIPTSVEQISGGAFRGIYAQLDKAKNAKFILIPQNVIKMAKNAFTFVPEINLAYVFVSKAEFVDIVPNPIYLDDISELAVPLKNKATQGFLQAVRCNRPEIEPFKEGYSEFIRNNFKTYVEYASWNENIFHYFIQEKIIPEKWIPKVLNGLEKEKRVDLKAELLAYQNALFDKREKDSLVLSNRDPEIKRAVQTQERREMIKKQKGIKGITFVATGDLEHFGTDKYYSYDQSAKATDRSDLKSYIEEHGGFLRNAVSSKTDYLISNDPSSESVKSKMAKELGVPIITENQFMKMAEQTE